jgi:hypothetical protein
MWWNGIASGGKNDSQRTEESCVLVVGTVFPPSCASGWVRSWEGFEKRRRQDNVKQILRILGRIMGVVKI